MVHLADHRPDAAHLPHQPLHDEPVAVLVLGYELAGLVGEIEQDGAGLEQRAAVVAVDDRGDAVVGADLQEVGLELLVLGDVDRMCGIVEPALLEHDGDLAAVGRRPRVEIDHLGVLMRRARLDRDGAVNVRR